MPRARRRSGRGWTLSTRLGKAVVVVGARDVMPTRVKPLRDVQVRRKHAHIRQIYDSRPASRPPPYCTLR
jgi:hypothetical protein